MNEPPKSQPTKKTTPSARMGLFLVLSGLLMSLPMLFFAPLIMCGVTVYTIPMALGAIVMGWKGRKENPKAALGAIFLGLALPPVAFALMWYFGELIYKATA